MQFTARRLEWILVAVLSLFLITTAIAGYLYYRRQEADFLRAADRELITIADLKVRQISTWFQERRGDADTILNTPVILDQARAFISNPDNPQLRRELLSWMGACQVNYGYERIVLYDSRGAIRLSTSADSEPTRLNADLLAHLQKALQSRTVVFNDLHRHSSNQTPIMAFWIPVPGKSDAGELADGALLFQIDPKQFLYPCLLVWPTPSITAETLLIRKEGNTVVYLNELRHRTNTALTLRLPINRPNLPSADAALGLEGIRRGLDYRDVPVLAALKAVPGTPWFMVAKVDAEEVYAPLRQRAWSAATFVSVLALAASFATALVWNQKNTQFLAQQIVSERQRQSLNNRISQLTKQANDCILLADSSWRILEANDRAFESYGYSNEELKKLTLIDLRAPTTREDFGRQISQSNLTDGVIVESLHQRKDGTIFPVESSMRTVDFEGQTIHQAIIRDISVRKQAEMQIQRQDTLLKAINRVLKHTLVSSTEEVLAKTCLEEAQVLTGSRFGFIGEINRAGLLDDIAISDSGWDACRMPDLGVIELARNLELRSDWGRVVRRGQPEIVNNPDSDPDRRGIPEGHPQITSFLGVPLKQDGRTLGIIALANKESGYEQTDLTCIESLSVAFVEALHRRRAEEALRQAHAELEQRVIKRTAELAHANKALQGEIGERGRAEKRIKTLNVDLERRAGELEAANSELEAFSYSVSHDLRAPLRAVDGFARILGEEYSASLDQEGQRVLGIIRSETTRMGQLIDDLLTFSRLGRREIQFTDINMDGLAHTVFGECAGHVSGREFRLKMGPLLPVRGDPVMMRQVLANLFSNALKYTKLRDVAEIEVESRADGNKNIYSVKDNGVGFDMKYSAKLFGVFQRLHSDEEFEGTGVGLALVQRIVHRHGGRVWAEGKVNGGAAFFFSLPNGKEGA